MPAIPDDFLNTVVFPTEISYGAEGGPDWLVSVTADDAGFETRVLRWADAIHRYNVTYGVRRLADMVNLLQFFNAVRGQAYIFCFVDPFDNNSIETPDFYNHPNGMQTVSAFDQVIGSGDGATVDFQLVKNYNLYGNNWSREIKAPYDVVLSISNIEELQATDQGLGVYRFKNFTQSITAITKANPCVVTIDANGANFAGTGQTVYISGVAGMTQINNARYKVLSRSGNNITLDLDSSAFSTYTSGGTMGTAPRSGETVRAGYRFYVPCRFDQRRLSARFDDYENTSAQANLVEVRL